MKRLAILGLVLAGLFALAEPLDANGRVAFVGGAFRRPVVVAPRVVVAARPVLVRSNFVGVGYGGFNNAVGYRPFNFALPVYTPITPPIVASSFGYGQTFSSGYGQSFGAPLAYGAAAPTCGAAAGLNYGMGGVGLGGYGGASFGQGGYGGSGFGVGGYGAGFRSPLLVGGRARVVFVNGRFHRGF